MMKKYLMAATLVLHMLTAEESGVFVGADLGVSNLTLTIQTKDELDTRTNSALSLGNFRYGLIGGYKWFFTENFGIRAYFQVNNGTNQIPISPLYNESQKHRSIKTLNTMLNVDALYNFYSTQENASGIFAGLSLGYAKHFGKSISGFSQNIFKDISGFDMGINFGLRSVFAKHHSIEVFNRFGLVGAKDSATITDEFGETTDIKVSIFQPYAFGVRYIFAF